MADIIINGTTYSGSPTNTSNPQRPNTIERTIEKIGRMIRAADGTTTWVHRGFKHKWVIKWEKANAVTEVAVTAIIATTGSFSFTDISGVAYTVVVVGDDEYKEGITSNRSNAYLYDMELVLREV